MGVVWVLGGLLFTVDGSDLITKTFEVPSKFLTAIPENGWTAKAALAKDLRELGKDSSQKTAKEVFVGAGIYFGEGTSATYDPTTSLLTVRNTAGQLELIDSLLESFKAKVEKHIYLTVREATFEGNPFAKGGKFEDVLPRLESYADNAGIFKLGQAQLNDFIESLAKAFPDQPGAAKADEVEGTIECKVYDSYDSFYDELSRPEKVNQEGATLQSLAC